MSLLEQTAIRVKRHPKRFLRFRYRADTILKRLGQAMTCSAGTRSLDMRRLACLSFLLKGFRLLRFWGMVVLPWSFCRPR